MEYQVTVTNGKRNYWIFHTSGDVLPTGHEIYGLTINIRSPISWMADIVLGRDWVDISVGEERKRQSKIKAEDRSKAISYKRRGNNYYEFTCEGMPTSHDIYGILNETKLYPDDIYETIKYGKMKYRRLRDNIYSDGVRYGSIRRYD